jgi:hypothetical protein
MATKLSIDDIDTALASLERQGRVERVGVRDGRPTFRAIPPVVVKLRGLAARIRAGEFDDELNDEQKEEIAKELESVAEEARKELLILAERAHAAESKLADDDAWPDDDDGEIV